MAEHSTSPRVDRELRRIEWSRRIDQAISECACSEVRLADDLGVNRKTLRKWRDHASGSSMPVGAVAALPPHARRRVVAALAETLGMTLAELPGEQNVNSDVRLLGRVAKETSEVVGEYADAMADGTLNAVEAGALDREATEAIEVLATLRRKAREILRERVRGLKVVG